MDKWNLPNCIGALDGKHIHYKVPKNTGSEYYNYKGSFSIVLMAVADAHYRFLYINVGAKGSTSDGGVFNSCSLYAALNNNTLQVPANRPLPGRTMPNPCCIRSNTGAASNMGTIDRVYNYRISRGRRVIENAFGICSARWRCLRRTMEQCPKTTDN